MNMTKIFTTKEVKNIQEKIKDKNRLERNVFYNTLVTEKSNKLLRVAKKGYKDEGRGLLVMSFQKSHETRFASQKLFKELFGTNKETYEKVAHVLGNYEPDTQFVVMIEDQEGTSFLIHSKRHLKMK